MKAASIINKFILCIVFLWIIPTCSKFKNTYIYNCIDYQIIGENQMVSSIFEDELVRVQSSDFFGIENLLKTDSFGINKTDLFYYDNITVNTSNHDFDFEVIYPYSFLEIKTLNEREIIIESYFYKKFNQLLYNPIKAIFQLKIDFYPNSNFDNSININFRVNKDSLCILNISGMDWKNDSTLEKIFISIDTNIYYAINNVKINVDSISFILK